MRVELLSPRLGDGVGGMWVELLSPRLGDGVGGMWVELLSGRLGWRVTVPSRSLEVELRASIQRGCMTVPDGLPPAISTTFSSCCLISLGGKILLPSLDTTST